MSRNYILSVFFIAFISLQYSCTSEKETSEPLTHYLFAYFTSNETADQQICYAVSENGLDFTPLNGGAPVIASDTISRSGGVRYPHLLRAEDGSILLSLTDMDWQRGKWTCQGTGRRKFTASRLTDFSTWELIEGLMKPEEVTMRSEGSSAYRLNDDSAWVLAYDCFADGVFHFCTSTDLKTFTLVCETKTAGNFTPRHGSILPITTREYERLIQHFKESTSPARPPTTSTCH